MANYRGSGDNYEDYLNYSMFPTSSYYVEEEIIIPQKEQQDAPDLSVLPDTVRIQTCLNNDYREELADLVEAMNDPTLFGGRIKVDAVQNDEIKKGNYDAVLVAISGYRSNFLFDLYNLFLREPDFETYKLNLHTKIDKKGKVVIDEQSFQPDKNFFRIGLNTNSPEQQDFRQLLEYVYGFMSTREIGDKQYYARYIDELDQRLALGSWLFSLPSLAYFSTQFDNQTIDLYGTASQLSTIEKWQERKKSNLYRQFRRTSGNCLINLTQTITTSYDKPVLEVFPVPDSVAICNIFKISRFIIISDPLKLSIYNQYEQSSTSLKRVASSNTPFQIVNRNEYGDQITEALRGSFRIGLLHNQRRKR